MKKITMLQIGSLFMLTTGLSNHVIIIPILLQTAKRDAWISVIISLVPVVLWILILYYISGSMQGKPLSAWLRQKLPAFFTWLLIILLAVYLFATAFITLKDTATWARTVYLPQTPLFILLLLLAILCTLAAGAGINAIAIISWVLLPFVIILGLFVMTVNFQFKDYSLLFPLFTHGYTPALKGMLYVMSSFGELIILLLIQHHLAAKVRLFPLLLVAFILAELTIGPLIGSIAMFGPFEAAAQRYPPFEQWRMASIGRFVTHLDFLSIYQWMSGAFIRISLAMFLIIDLLGIKKKRIISLSIVAAMLISLGLIPVSDNVFMEVISIYFYPILLGIVSAISLLLGVIAWLTRKDGGNKIGN